MIFSKAIRSSLCAVLLAAPPTSATANAEPARAIEVATWRAYGASSGFEPDGEVPGGGAVRIDARGVPGEIWSSGAGMAIADPLRAGERVTGVFWAKAARPTRVAVTIQGGAPAYAAFATARIDLTPAWRRYMVGGVAPGDRPAGSQSLTVQTGHATTAVSLGPVAFLRGRPDDAATARAFAGFRPAQVAADVRIPSDPGVTLAGTLRLPGRTGVGPHPAVVLLSGHGPWSRGGFPLLVERLTAAGIATLDYDKRGIGRSTGTFVDTMELMERDASAAVAYLRARRDIDGGRVAILGLSQGGVVAPGVAAGDPAIAAVVMLAGPAGERGKLFLDGMRAQLISGGTRRDAVEPILAATAPFMEARAAAASPLAMAPLERALGDAFVAGGHMRGTAAGFVAMLGDPVVVSQYRVAANDALRRVRSPVLALYAGEDDVVLTSLSMPEAEAALRRNPDATVVEMPRVNHTFQRRETDASGKSAYAGPSVSDPATLDLIGRWLGSRLQPGRR